MNQSTSTANLFAALSKAQSEIRAVGFDSKNPFLNTRFASLGAIIESSRQVLASNGLSLTQFVVGDSGNVGIESVLAHKSGEFISERFTLPMVEEKGKSRAQLAGSFITYLRRYCWASILGMYADEDTDATHDNSKPVTKLPLPPMPGRQH